MCLKTIFGENGAFDSNYMYVAVLRPITENTFADRQIAEFQFADFLFAPGG
jgi:hypothetical protein